MRRQLRSVRDAVTRWSTACGESWLPDAILSPPTMVDGSSGLKQIQLNPTIEMVSLVRDESGRISKHVF